MSISVDWMMAEHQSGAGLEITHAATDLAGIPSCNMMAFAQGSPAHITLQ